MRQLELPFDDIRVSSMESLQGIRSIEEQMRIRISDLLDLADSLCMKDEHHVVIGISDVRALKRIQEMLVGRTTQMIDSQHKRYRLLLARLAQFAPQKTLTEGTLPDSHYARRS